MLSILRTSILFSSLSCCVLAFGLAAQAQVGKKLARDAGRNQDIRQQLIAAGVLDVSSEIVPSEQVKSAVQLFINTYFDSPPADDISS